MEHANRIAKDISARKNTKPPSTLAAMEMEIAALKAANEAYVNSIKQGYEQRIESMESEREIKFADMKLELQTELEPQVVNLKAEHKKELDSALEKQKLAAEDALQKVQSEVSTLQQEIQARSREEIRLQTSLNETQKELQQARHESKGLTAQFKERIGTLQTSHSKEVHELQAELRFGPNSWFELHFKSHSRKDRTFVRRPSARFKDAVEELCISTRLPYNMVSFSLRGKVIFDSFKTLAEIGIKDGDRIRYEKKPC